MIRRTPRGETTFVVIQNKACVEDARLSWKARGLLVYLLSKPDHWEVRESQLVAAGTDGLAAVRTGLAELEAVGYLRRDWVRSEGGTFAGRESTVYDTPQPPLAEDTQVSTDVRLSDSGSSANGESPALVRTEVLARTEEAIAAPPLMDVDETPGARMERERGKGSDYRFGDAWDAYPARHGRRVGRAQALDRWKRLSYVDKAAAFVGIRHLAEDVAADRTIPKDMHRWLQHRLWQDYQAPAVGDVTQQQPKQRGATTADPDWVQDEWERRTAR